MRHNILFVAASIPILASCAAFQSDAKEVVPQQTAAIEATCTKVMRLHKWQAQFEACVSSLSGATASVVKSDCVNNAYRSCAQTGLKRETPEFSRCVLDSENIQRDAGSLPTGAAAELNAAYITSADSNPEDYLESTFKMRHRREQYACAQLGLEPDTGAFVSCVNNLDMEIFLVDHPNG
jgi:hypothetical protein